MSVKPQSYPLLTFVAQVFDVIAAPKTHKRQSPVHVARARDLHVQASMDWIEILLPPDALARYMF